MPDPVLFHRKSDPYGSLFLWFGRLQWGDVCGDKLGRRHTGEPMEDPCKILGIPKAAQIGDLCNGTLGGGQIQFGNLHAQPVQISRRRAAVGCLELLAGIASGLWDAVNCLGDVEIRIWHVVPHELRQAGQLRAWLPLKPGGQKVLESTLEGRSVNCMPG